MSELSGFPQKGNAIWKVYTTDYYTKAREAHSCIQKISTRAERDKNIYKSTSRVLEIYSDMLQ